jgi:H+-transporting ATPase
MYLKLSVAGHLTIFLTRTRGHFWSIRPARILWMAVLGTQIIATFIAVYGFLMPPLGWTWAACVWGYAIAWFLVTDPIKLLAYRILDPVKVDSNPQPQLEQKPMTTAKAKPEAKVDPEADVKAAPEAKAVANTKPAIAAKTAEPFQAEVKTKLEPAVTPEAETKAKPQAKADPKANAKPIPQPKVAPDNEPKPNTNAKTQSEADTASQPEANAKPEAKTETSDNLTPQLVSRVHKLYEELGRDEVQAVHDMEQAAQKVKVSK